MKRFALAALAACAALLAAEGVAAQLSLSGELRGGAAFPTGELREVGPLGGEGLETGYVVGGRALVHLTPAVGVYAGLSLSRFEARDTLSIAVEDAGLGAGVRIVLPGRGGISPWLEGGVVHRRAELVFGDEFFPPVPQKVAIGDAALGFEAGGGVSLPLGWNLSLTPGITYVRHTREVPPPEDDPEAEPRQKTLSHLRAELGVQFRP